MRRIWTRLAWWAGAKRWASAAEWALRSPGTRWTAAALASLLCPPASAVYDPLFLQSIEHFKLVSNEPDDAARACGVADYSPYLAQLGAGLETLGLRHDPNAATAAVLLLTYVRHPDAERCSAVAVLSLEQDRAERLEDTVATHWVKLYANHAIFHDALAPMTEATAEAVDDLLRALERERQSGPGSALP